MSVQALCRLPGHDVSLELYARVVDILQAQQGFLLNGYKDLCIRRRLAARIRAAGYRKVEEYIHFLAADNGEQEQLLAALSVHVSHFFRNPSVYKVLERRVLPELANCAQRRKGKLRIWSVGCAYGEEPYSLALLSKKIGLKPQNLSIVASDLSPDALKKARQGVFEENRLNHVPISLRQDCFLAVEKGWRLRKSVRDQVQFFRHDILADQPFTGLI